MDINVSVQAIQGIGPATAAALSDIGIDTISHLVSVHPTRVQPHIALLASLDEVEAWHAAGHLLEIEAMTPDWAEALVAAGLDSIEHLIYASLDDLQAALEAGMASGATADSPDTGTWLELVRDAAALHFGGLVTLTVTDEDGTPLEGAQVGVSGAAAVTDARGHARLSAIAPAPRHFLRVEASGFSTHVDPDYPVVYDSHHYAPERLTLQPLAPGEIDEATVRADEYNGDVLPSFAAACEVVRLDLGAADLRDGDVLLLQRFYADGRDVRVVSVFDAYAAGRRYNWTARVPKDLLPEGAEVGDAFRWTGQALEPVPATLSYFDGARARRRAAVVLADDPAYQEADLVDRLQRYFDAVDAARSLRDLAGDRLDDEGGSA